MGRRSHRVIAAAAEAHGDDVIGPLYEAIGERTWEVPGPTGGFDDVLRALDEQLDLPAALAAVDLPTELAEAADDDSFDHLFDKGTEEAQSRAGEDVGTPIITFAPDGDQPASFFGPVISEVPDPEQSVEFYRAIETATRVPSFSELKRSQRDAPDLPLMANLD
jgi:hypothetical protein